MTEKVVGSVAGYRCVSKLYNALMTGLVLTLITRRDAESARRFVFAHFRRQHLEKFLSGLQKLGLDRLPHAMACAQYHYFSNARGGVKTQYMRESDRKAWVRYPPPRWYQGWRRQALGRDAVQARIFSPAAAAELSFPDLLIGRRIHRLDDVTRVDLATPQRDGRGAQEAAEVMKVRRKTVRSEFRRCICQLIV